MMLTLFLKGNLIAWKWGKIKPYYQINKVYKWDDFAFRLRFIE